MLDKKKGKIEHKHFYDIVDYLDKGDVLVLNNSKVFPARLIGKRKGTGGKVEVFLLKKFEENAKQDVGALPLRLRSGQGAMPACGESWQCLVGGHRRKMELEVEFEKGLSAKIINDNSDGTFDVLFNKTGKGFMSIVEKIGQIPLPPYIHRTGIARNAPTDRVRYQTVYADNKRIGSVAAPTAGLHFTPALLNKLKKKGVEIEYITLHVGLGTFAPVKIDDITKHKIHAEWIEVDAGTIKRIVTAKQEGRRIFAVGTTSVRTLEALSSVIARSSATKQSREIMGNQFSEHVINTTGLLCPFDPAPFDSAQDWQDRLRARNDRGFSGWVNIFIYPGYKFKVVDAMITNFHLPKSTLLMLVSAFAGKKTIDKAYKSAIKEKYRFYSYGDAMMIV